MFSLSICIWTSHIRYWITIKDHWQITRWQIGWLTLCTLLSYDTYNRATASIKWFLCNAEYYGRGFLSVLSNWTIPQSRWFECSLREFRWWCKNVCRLIFGDLFRIGGYRVDSKSYFQRLFFRLRRFSSFFLSFLVNWHRLYQAFDGQYRRFRYWKCKDLYSFKVIIFFRSHFFIQIQLNGWRMWISLHSKGISCIKWGVLRRYFKNPGTFFFIVKILPILEVLRIMWENMDSSCFEKKKLHKNLTEMTFEDYNSAVYICFLCFLDFY